MSSITLCSRAVVIRLDRGKLEEDGFRLSFCVMY
jgi:hypothetical protein